MSQQANPASSVPAKAGPSWLDVIQPFAIGGLSGCTATCFIQPMDLVKVRIQIKNEELKKVYRLKPLIIQKEKLNLSMLFLDLNQLRDVKNGLLIIGYL